MRPRSLPPHPLTDGDRCVCVCVCVCVPMARSTRTRTSAARSKRACGLAATTRSTPTSAAECIPRTPPRISRPPPPPLLPSTLAHTGHHAAAAAAQARGPQERRQHMLLQHAAAELLCHSDLSRLRAVARLCDLRPGPQRAVYATPSPSCAQIPTRLHSRTALDVDPLLVLLVPLQFCTSCRSCLAS